MEVRYQLRYSPNLRGPADHGEVRQHIRFTGHLEDRPGDRLPVGTLR
jgi:hypothetical protein